ATSAPSRGPSGPETPHHLGGNLRPAATDHQVRDAAETGALTPLLGRIGEALDDYLRFERPDALVTADDWRRRLSRPLPERGVGIAAVAEELAATVIPNGSAVPRPGFTGFITTGGVTASTLASTAASVA